MNEYSEGEIKRLMDKFREEADDLNINITDEQLKVFIERFDSLKGSPKVTEKDLRKYSLSKLIRLVGRFKGGEPPDQSEITPDVVYNENGLVIYNGSKEDNCLTYGRNEKWCITRGSFGSYRYDKDRKYPTFYLVKDNNLPDNDPKSFFVVVVGNDNTYKVSDRTNNDVGGQQTEWQRWESWPFVERNFPSITGLKNVFKYIPLSNQEKVNQQYKRKSVTLREWIKFPYSVKEQYLVVRKDKELFSDISTDEFVEKYLPKYPQIATFVSTNEGIIEPEILVKHLDKFSNQDRKSIISNMRTQLDSKLLSSETIPFDVKKLLVKLNKWFVDTDERLYVTSDGKAIVKLTFEDDLKMSVYTEEDDYSNVKINKRTGKYIADYPEIDLIPFKELIKLSSEEILPSDTVDKVLKKSQEDPNSGIIVKDAENGEIIIDTNSFTSFKKEGNKIKPVSFDNEEVQNALSTETENTSLQDNAVSLFKSARNIPVQVDKDALTNIIKATPYDKRKFSLGSNDVVLLVADGDDESQFVLMPSTIKGRNFLQPIDFYKKGSDWRESSATSASRILRDVNIKNLAKAYIGYLRNENIALTDDMLKRFLNESNIDESYKAAFFETDPLLANDNIYVPKKINNRYLLVNRQNPRESLEVSSARNNLKRAPISPRDAATLLGTRPAAATPGNEPETGGTRRGRPAGVPNAPRQQAAVEPGEGVINTVQLATDLGLLRGLSTMSPRIASRFPNNWRPVSVINNRGASRRQNQLGGAGRVRQAFESGSNAMYNIRLNDGTELLSIVLQPGNTHLLATPTGTVLLNSPSDLMNVLTNRNLIEGIKKVAVKMYLAENPNMLDETMDIIKNLLNKKDEN